MDRRSLLLLTAAGLAAGCARSSTSTGPGASVDVQLAEPVQRTSPMVTAEHYFAEQLAELTDGRYRVTVMPGGVLGDDNRVTEMVRTGQVAFCKTLMANLTAYDKRLGVASLPYAFASREQCLQSLDGDLGKRCAAILAEHGLVVLTYFYGGDRSIYNRIRPIRTPADLTGLRIRVPQNIVSIDMINTLGADAVPMATNDIMSALQQKLVDGAENSIVFYVTEQHLPYAPYYSWTRHQHAVDALMVSQKWLSEQPSAVRDAVVEAGRLAGEEELRLWAAATDQKTDLATRQGGHLDEVDVEAFRAVLAPVIRSHRGTFGDLTALLPDGG
ncbi:TRAP transporter substrate-binding protein DctP [Actinoplanes sichuanensis]|uniref:TRAP transporter substrate-binding protein DctP n=1 Tax=Actinoplanes sichuanensis TaxID=512349 RepID=A0ABW4ACK3_9ACTN|nr:TRAP transporter substrate-binding protein DctP [Actinoplanes sichuanensis]